MNEYNVEDILLVLEKIAKKTGEDEDDYIYDLERQFDIKITEKEVSSLREILRAECIWIWVLKPFNQKDFKVEKEYLYFIKHQPPNSINKFVKKKKLDGKYYIKYPKYIMLSNVQDYIFEHLFEEYGINYDDFAEIEWEGIITSKQFKSAEIQVARELIANEIYHGVSKQSRITEIEEH